MTDADCSYGGICEDPVDTGTCLCDPWFTGEFCDLLNMQAPEDTDVGTCGPSFDGYYSWGGRTVQGSDGMYHLFASFMCNHASLSEWTTVSSSAHFVAATPTGPFAWSPEQCDAQGICTPFIQPWSHNTVIVPNAAGASPPWLVFHIGNGIVPPSQWAPCFNKSDIGTVGQGKEGPSTLSPDQRYEAMRAMRSGERFGIESGFYLATSDSLDGPWTAAMNNSAIIINLNNTWATQAGGNPAPLLSPDGSQWLLYFTGTSCPPGWGLAPGCIAMATSPTYQGPYTVVPGPNPLVNMESEDPFVWRDPRGNFHMHTNINTYHRRCAQGVPCGGHAWSSDGFKWSNQTLGAFGPVVTLANGTVIQNAYSERPLVTQNPDGSPLALHLGMGRSSYEDSCNWVQLFCTNTSKNCGPMLPSHKSGLFMPLRGR